MLEPFSPSDWTVYHAAHLLNRAGFGGTPEEIRKLYALGLNDAVDSLLAGEEDEDLFPAPVWARAMDENYRQLFQRGGNLSSADAQKLQELKRQFFKQNFERLVELRAWWTNRMRYTTYPLREKATLFWHGHFATGSDKVREPYLLLTQNETLRANALGNFGTLTREISRDPAMMLYLDTDKSAAAHPNENFARELMELFTLGEGHYTEKDFNSLRAFTGYRINRGTGQYVFDPRHARRRREGVFRTKRQF